MRRSHRFLEWGLLAVLAGAVLGCSPRVEVSGGLTEMPPQPQPSPNPSADKPGPTELATVGGGCFWCLEAVYQQLPGVVKVTSGYMGGKVPNPTYEQVCSGETGHAEVVQVTYDPKVISYETLLEWFWKMHDPTTLNRQGNDMGTQYPSAIFYHSPAQREAAEKSKKAMDEAKAFPRPIVTQIAEASTYYVAEDYHQNYYRLNKNQGYCRAIIAPKLDKLKLAK